MKKLVLLSALCALTPVVHWAQRIVPNAIGDDELVAAVPAIHEEVAGTTHEVAVNGGPALHISHYDTEDPIEVGMSTVYVFEVRNEGTAPCTNVVVSSSKPAEMTIQGVSATSALETLTFRAIRVMKPGDKAVFKVVYKATKSGSAKHRVTVTYDEFSKPILDEEGTSVYQ